MPQKPGRFRRAQGVADILLDPRRPRVVTGIGKHQWRRRRIGALMENRMPGAASRGEKFTHTGTALASRDGFKMILNQPGAEILIIPGGIAKRQGDRFCVNGGIAVREKSEN